MKVKGIHTIILVFLVSLGCNRFKIDPPECYFEAQTTDIPNSSQLDGTENYIKFTVEDFPYSFLASDFDISLRNRCVNDCAYIHDSRTDGYTKEFQLTMTQVKDKEDLLNSVGVRTAILGADSLRTTPSSVVHVNFKIYNSCGREFEPSLIEDTSGAFYHEITEARLDDSYVYLHDGEDYDHFDYTLFGRFTASYDALGEEVEVVGQYQIAYAVNQKH